jgi:hypothetical protein
MYWIEASRSKRLSMPLLYKAASTYLAGSIIFDLVRLTPEEIGEIQPGPIRHHSLPAEFQGEVEWSLDRYRPVHFRHAPISQPAVS